MSYFVVPGGDQPKHNHIFSLLHPAFSILLLWQNNYSSNVIILPIPESEHHNKLSPLQKIMAIQLSCDQLNISFQNLMAGILLPRGNNAGFKDHLGLSKQVSNRERQKLRTLTNSRMSCRNRQKHSNSAQNVAKNSISGVEQQEDTRPCNECENLEMYGSNDAQSSIPSGREIMGEVPKRLL